MIKVEKEFDHGYAKPVNRGVILWNGDRDNREGPEQWIDNLVYEPLGEEIFWSDGHYLEGVKITIEITKATRQ